MPSKGGKTGALRRISEWLKDERYQPTWDKNNPVFEQLVARKGWDPELHQEDADRMVGYGEGNLWHWDREDHPHLERFDNIIKEHGIPQNDFQLWRGMELPPDLVHNLRPGDTLRSIRPQSASIDKSMADEFSELGAQGPDAVPTLATIHPTGGLVLPNPFAGQSELILPSRDRGILAVNKIRRHRGKVHLDTERVTTEWARGGQMTPQQRLKKIQSRHYAEGGKVRALSYLAKQATSKMNKGHDPSEQAMLQDIANRLKTLRVDAGHRERLNSALLSAQDAAAEPHAPGSQRRFAASRDEFLGLANQVPAQSRLPDLTPSDVFVAPVNPLNHAEGFTVAHGGSGLPIIGSNRMLSEEEAMSLMTPIQDWIKMTPEQRAASGMQKVGPDRRTMKPQKFGNGGLTIALTRTAANNLGFKDPKTGTEDALRYYDQPGNAKGWEYIRDLAKNTKKGKADPVHIGGAPGNPNNAPIRTQVQPTQTPVPIFTGPAPGGSSAPAPVPHGQSGSTSGAGVLGPGMGRVRTPADLDWWLTYGSGPEWNFFTNNGVAGAPSTAPGAPAPAPPQLQNPLPGLRVPSRSPVGIGSPLASAPNAIPYGMGGV